MALAKKFPKLKFIIQDMKEVSIRLLPQAKEEVS